MREIGPSLVGANVCKPEQTQATGVFLDCALCNAGWPMKSGFLQIAWFAEYCPNTTTTTPPPPPLVAKPALPPYSWYWGMAPYTIVGLGCVPREEGSEYLPNTWIGTSYERFADGKMMKIEGMLHQISVSTISVSIRTYVLDYTSQTWAACVSFSGTLYRMEDPSKVGCLACGRTYVSNLIAIGNSGACCPMDLKYVQISAFTQPWMTGCGEVTENTIYPHCSLYDEAHTYFCFRTLTYSKKIPFEFEPTFAQIGQDTDGCWTSEPSFVQPESGRKPPCQCYWHKDGVSSSSMYSNAWIRLGCSGEGLHARNQIQVGNVARTLIPQNNEFNSYFLILKSVNEGPICAVMRTGTSGVNGYSYEICATEVVQESYPFILKIDCTDTLTYAYAQRFPNEHVIGGDCFGTTTTTTTNTTTSTTSTTTSTTTTGPPCGTCEYSWYEGVHQIWNLINNNCISECHCHYPSEAGWPYASITTNCWTDREYWCIEYPTGYTCEELDSINFFRGRTGPHATIEECAAKCPEFTTTTTPEPNFKYWCVRIHETTNESVCGQPCKKICVLAPANFQIGEFHWLPCDLDENTFRYVEILDGPFATNFLCADADCQNWKWWCFESTEDNWWCPDATYCQLPKGTRKCYEINGDEACYGPGSEFMYLCSGPYACTMDKWKIVGGPYSTLGNCNGVCDVLTTTTTTTTAEPYFCGYSPVVDPPVNHCYLKSQHPGNVVVAGPYATLQLCESACPSATTTTTSTSTTTTGTSTTTTTGTTTTTLGPTAYFCTQVLSVDGPGCPKQPNTLYCTIWPRDSIQIGRAHV